jgi:hypothetical protein
MNEVQLLELFSGYRTQMDTALAQTIGISSALVVGIYYFLHRSGIAMKIAIFVLFALGWFISVSSGALAAQQLSGVVHDLVALAGKEEVGQSTMLLLETLRSPTNTAYVVAANAVNFLMLIGGFLFLFFWKPPVVIEGSGAVFQNAED